MTNKPLERLARRASVDPLFLGWRLDEYARLHKLDESKLAARLGCHPTLMPTIRLCRAPRSEAVGFRDDVLCIAKRFGLCVRALAEMAKSIPAEPLSAAPPVETPGVLLAARDRGDPP